MLNEIKEAEFRDITDTHPPETLPIPVAKYCVVPSFFETPTEIEAVDLVMSYNKETGEGYLQFIGTDGRLYKLPREKMGLVIINNPNKDQIADFARLRKEADAAEIKVTEKKDKSDIYG